MNKGLIAGVLLVVFVAGYWLAQAGSLEPPGAPAPTMRTLDEIPPPEAVLVGFTTATFPPTAAVFGFTQACNAEFAGSRWCTSVEVMNSTNIPDLSNGTNWAWVRPVLVHGSTIDRHVDASGLYNNPNTTSFTCDGWRQLGSNYYALIVSSIGSFTGQSCADPTTFSVACCAPPIP